MNAMLAERKKQDAAAAYPHAPPTVSPSAARRCAAATVAVAEKN